MLELERISRRFGAVQALDEASLVVRAGTVHAVLGENGAGKTTLLRVAFGLQRPDGGVVRWQGNVVSIPTPAAALALGIGMVHQHFTLVPAMTVAENVALGAGGRYDPRAAADRVRDVAARAGLALDPAARVDSLPVGAQQRCEIVKALARDVRLLILDEPTAVLAPAESRELLGWIRRFADAGHAVVLITHRLRDALATADDVTVLRRGRTVYSGPAASASEASLAAAMLGEEAGDADGAERAEGAVHAPPRAAEGPVVLHANDLHVHDARGVERVRGASMVARAGEIVGIAAVEGAGQHELLRALVGLVRPGRGQVVRTGSVGWVPEDRHHDALLLDAPLFENVALKGAGARRGRVPWGALRETTRELIARFDVRADSERAVARTLSGGNQQKLVLARELAGAPDALVVENPTRGLDFRATAAVHRALREARDRGAAVVLYSSDLDETLLLADRVYAMHDGRLTGMPKDREAVGRAMLGSAT